jgi:hypothetical protein
MKNKFEFNAQEVVCNGIVAGCGTVLTEKNQSILKTFINTHFLMVDKKQLLQELEDSNRIIDPWIVGSRAGDTDAIISRMVSGLLQYAYAKFNYVEGYQKLSEMWINAQVEMMSAKDVITIMESALIDCATADHWYMYEKQWD